MTELSKPLRRRCAAKFMHYKKWIVATLLPHDRLQLHLERTRLKLIADIADIYKHLANRYALAERRRKAEARADRRRS